MQKTFRGVYTVMITPLDPSGAVDLKGLAAFTDWQVKEGIHGLIPLGSTGEFLSLSEEERDSVARTVIETVAGRVPVLIGTGAEDTRESIRLSVKAEAMGADGVMIIPPFYSTPTDDELVHHYKSIASAVAIPIMVYNNPATANVDLTPELVKRIAEIDGCDYIKESTLEVTRVRDIIRLAGDDMTVFGGILGFESFVMGAQGWVAVASNVAPGPMARIFELVANEKKFDEARELYLKWLPVIQAVGGQAYVAGTKSLLTHMGFGAGLPRPPRLPLPPAQDAAMKKLVADFGLAFGA
ncbi:4-hydroxy-tetrahydrodipicolinate synthase [Rhizobium beringeri]|jgi:4-hydroxy-tetrahydrodipicolinate synthase|uniref:4-hydroxy-tetrahydrodipicolinate synthase n=2 Tax=Rhizobium TaxID=379 RepID=A0A444HQ87_RHILE|nr:MULTISPECIES: 4-hydroxy-tetrahydrodipicolinate synthase [Rhizobium]MBY5456092.1 4-hydroxy-tetrahydrodipicolinate synthase [Rhizobium leguminosarum]NKL62758.1 4-hydroxy-tetrahydrodipicolinate synthase [Rhizobium leguminosarum bv. viciae]RWX24898.1 4-hydroxy-tetrahydrodipicolinate synthase [Rhizobium leguminosarum]TAU55085.1 4-hydroxy-tetrahydrodipicolinate synthase [Rhizobium leguminosarum]TBC75054.1 4-hydroxy-tetrahydrodipicolinate synthase [Rhizobium leguminosarum]